jgi:hypothetical protein
MSQKNETYNPFDPAGMLKGLRDSSMEAWSKAMQQIVHTDAYAQATAAMLDAWMSTSTPFRKVIETTMTQALANANMPSRADLAALAERLTHIEVRLDDLDAKLDASRRSRSSTGGNKS